MKSSNKASAKQKRSRRRLLVESLESRLLLSADWRNPVDAIDVNRDGLVTPLDALVVLNEIARRNRAGISELEPRPVGSTLPFFDVDGNGEIVPLDALRVLVGIRPLTRSEYVLRESSSAAGELSVTIGLGGSEGTRTYQFDVDASFDSDSQSNVQDALAVYLVDPDSAQSTVLDRGEPGTAIFVLSGQRADFVPGMVRFDGRTVSVDLTELGDLDTGQLVFQLISQNDRSDTSITIRPHSNDIDVEGLIPPRFDLRGQTVAPGESLAIAGLSPAAFGQFETELHNIRFNRITGRYDAELQLINRGGPIGRDVAIAFPGLPEGAELIGSAGITLDGIPFLSLRPAIPAGGMGTGQRTDPVRVAITAPSLQRFSLATEVWIGEPNRAPIFPSIDPIVVTPGVQRTVSLAAEDPDGDRLVYSFRAVNNAVPLPPMKFQASTGELFLAPMIGDLGSWEIEVTASDGSLSASTTFLLEIVQDPVSTTRVSGRVLDIDQSPIASMHVEIGGVQTLTSTTGTFLIDLGQGPIASDTIKIRGELYSGPHAYPFIAEKLPLTLGRSLVPGINNEILRPIYLPKLDVASGTIIDPIQDMIVTTDNIPGVAVHIAAGTLLTQPGTPFQGVLSVTEVPNERTPISLPEGLLTDLVVTIQPGEMVFATPAPLTLPNRAGWEPGREMVLWSINPTTGEFDDVGRGVVSPDGMVVNTLTGGIRNSSWHAFVPAEPPDGPAPLILNSNNLSDDPFNFDPRCPDACVAKGPLTSEVELHSGAVLERHSTATYEANGKTWGLQLVYDSLRAAPRPIVNLGFQTDRSAFLAALLEYTVDGVSIVAPGYAGPQISSFPFRTTDFDDRPLRMMQGDHIWRTLPGNNRVAMQVDLGEVKTGVIPYVVNYAHNRLEQTLPGGWLRFSSLRGSRQELPGQFLHVNSVESPLGAGWGLAGLHRLYEAAGGAILLVDGDGSEMLFDPPTEPGLPYVSPMQDFSRLERLENGRFQRTHVDRTIDRFDDDHRLESSTDRNGNVTLYVYDAQGRLSHYLDPVGQQTTLSYDPATGRLQSIVDPIGRLTRFEHDEQGNLNRIIDPDDATRTFAYDQRHLMTGEIDPRGFPESVDYDFSGRAVRAVRKDGSEIRVQPIQTRGLLPPEATLPYRTVNYTRTIIKQDPLRPDEVIQIPGKLENVIVRPTATAFIDLPQTTTYMDSRGSTIASELNSAGQTQRSADVYGSVQSFQRGGTQNLIERSIIASGLETNFRYDERGNLISIEEFLKDFFAAESASDQFGFPGEILLLPHSTPSIITVGDMDNDGIEDIVLRVDDSNSIKVFTYFGREQGGFEEPYLLPFDTSERFVLKFDIADVNGDGLLDVVGRTAQDFQVLLNQGDRNFGQAIHTIPELSMVFFGTTMLADFNNDGHLDIIYDTAGTSVSHAIHLGNGNGTFQPASPLSSFPRLMVSDVADLNGDGNLDVIGYRRILGVSNVWSTILLAGNGDGTFADGISLTGGSLQTSNVKHFFVDDITGDGIPDLVVDNFNRRLVIHEGLGGTAFADPVTLVPGFFFDLVEIADVNDDGVLEIVIGALGLGEQQGEQLISIFSRGPSEFEFATFSTQRSSSPSFTSLAVIDVSGDGRKDIVTFQEGENMELHTFHANANGQFYVSPPSYTGSERDISNWQVGFANNDRNPDLIAANPEGMMTWLGTGSGNFSESVWTPIPLPDGPRKYFSMGDVNGDFLDDAVYVTHESDRIAVALSNGDGSFLPVELVRSPGLVFSELTLIDWNEDGWQDIVAFGQFNPEGEPLEFVAVFLNDGTGVFHEPNVTSLGTWRNIDEDVSVLAGQLIGDSAMDLVVVLNVADESRYLILEGDGNHGFTSTGLTQLTLPRSVPYSSRLVDFNDDGTLDIVSTESCANGSNEHGSEDCVGAVRLISNLGDGSFEVHQVVSDFLEFSSVDVGDMNGDGRPDLVTTSYRHGFVQAFFADEEGNFLPPRAFAIGKNYLEYVRLVDINRDGLLDVLMLDRALAFSETSRDAISVLLNGVSTNSVLASQSFTYDTVFNQMTSETDELGRTTFYDIDPANGNVRSVRQVVGELGGDDDLITHFSYLPNGQLEFLTDALGRETRFRYDSLGRTIAVEYSAGTPEAFQIEYEYDAAGNVIAMIDPLGRRQENRYDAMNRQTAARDPLGNETTWTYDKGGLVTQKRDSNQSVYTFEYDPMRRLLQTQDAGGNSLSYRYDLAGNRIESSYPDGSIQKTEFDARGRVTRQIDGDGAVTRFQYDSSNNITAIRDPEGNASGFFYDERGRKVLEIDPHGNERRYRYDVANRLIQITDRNNRIKQFVYDDLDRLTEEIWVGTDHRIQFEYDALGNVIRVEDQFSTIEYEHDANGRVASVTTRVHDNLPEIRVDYGFDAAGQLESRMDFLGGALQSVENYHKDANGRVTQLTQSGPSVSDKRVDYRFQTGGALESLTRFSDLDGATEVAETHFQYDDFFRLIGIEHAPVGGSPIGFEYEWTDDFITSVISNDGRVDLDYDSSGRLIQASYDREGFVDEAYSYDSSNNRSRSHIHGEDYVTGQGNQLTSDGAFAYEYDGEGNLVLRTNTTDQSTRRFIWDARNRLVSVIDRDAEGDLILEVTFTYDALNRRIAKEVDYANDDLPPSRTHFVYDGIHLAMEWLDLDADGPLEPIVSMRYLHGPGTDQLLAQEHADGRVEWLLTDRLGTVRDVIDNQGVPIQHFTYDAFGQFLGAEAENVSSRFGFTGREYDAELNLHYYRARYYDASLGRFLSQDTFEGGDVNVYAYAYSSPQMLTDPSGAIPPQVVGAIISGAIDAVTTAITEDFRCDDAGDIAKKLAISFGKGFLSGIVSGGLGKLAKVKELDKLFSGVGKVLRGAVNDIAFDSAASYLKGDSPGATEVAVSGLSAVPKVAFKEATKNELRRSTVEYIIRNDLDLPGGFVVKIHGRGPESALVQEVISTVVGKMVSESIDFLEAGADRLANPKERQSLYSRLKSGRAPACDCS